MLLWIATEMQWMRCDAFAELPLETSWELSWRPWALPSCTQKPCTLLGSCNSYAVPTEPPVSPSDAEPRKLCRAYASENEELHWALAIRSPSREGSHLQRQASHVKACPSLTATSQDL